MPQCSPFTQRIGEFESTLGHCRSLLEEYGKIGDAEIPEQIRQGLASLSKKRKEFMQYDYVPAVKNLLGTWGSASRDVESLSSFITILENGRVSVDVPGNFYVPNGATYFPHLIEQIGSNCIIIEGELGEMNHLVRARYLDIIADARISSMGALEKLTDNLYVAQKGFSPAFPRLKEIDGRITIGAETKIESFRAVFPQLTKIGAERVGSSLLSVFLHPNQAHLKEEILRLQQEGSLQVEGEVIIH